MTCHPVCVRFLAFLHRSVVPAPPPAHLNIHQVLWQYPSLLVYYNLSGFRPLTRFASKIVSVFVLGIGRMSSDANKLAIATSSPVSRTNSTAFETRFRNQRSTVICHSDRIYLWINQLGSNHPAFCTRLLPEVRHTKAIAQSIGCIQCWVEAFSEPTFGLCKICREAGVGKYSEQPSSRGIHGRHDSFLHPLHVCEIQKATATQLLHVLYGGMPLSLRPCQCLYHPCLAPDLAS